MNRATINQPQRPGHCQSNDAQLAAIDHLVASPTRTTPTTRYPSSAYKHWPDHGLNRILAAFDSFNSDELSEIECLEMLFYLGSRRPDARQVAEGAINTYGSLATIFQRPGRELREFLGMDHAMTALLAIVKSSLKFILTPELSDREELKSYDDLMNYCALDLRGAEQEILRIIYLDTKCRIIKDEEIARGTVDTVPIYPKEVARRAAAFCASSVVLAHNHLGDDPTPSRSDIEATTRTKGALQLFDIVLHDHVIVARSRCFSMQQQGLI